MGLVEGTHYGAATFGYEPVGACKTDAVTTVEKSIIFWEGRVSILKVSAIVVIYLGSLNVVLNGWLHNLQFIIVKLT